MSSSCNLLFSLRSGSFLVCFLGNTDIASDVHCRSDGFILTTWTLSSYEIVQLKSKKYILQHLSIRILKFPVLMFYVLSIWVTTSHQHTDIVTWNKTNNTGISNIKYLKSLRIYSSAINIEISVKFPLVRWCRVFHGSGEKSYFNTKTIGKLLSFILMLKILCILHSYVIICVKWIRNGSSPVRKAREEEKGQG